MIIPVLYGKGRGFAFGISANKKNICKIKELLPMYKAGILKIKANVYYSFCKQKMDFRACIGEADLLQLKGHGP